MFSPATFQSPTPQFDVSTPPSARPENTFPRLVQTPAPRQETKTTARLITTGDALLKLREDWQALHRSLGKSHFTDPDWTLAWWRHIGEPSGWRLHVVTIWQDGELVALAPLATIRKKGMRVLQWAGTDVFDYSDTLARTGEQAELLWRAVRQSRRYQVACLKSIREDSASHAYLTPFASLLRQSRNHYLPLSWRSGAAWVAALPSADRKEYKRRQRRLEERGALSFDVVRCGPEVAGKIGRSLAQKKAWCTAKDCRGVFDEPGAQAFFRQLGEIAGEKSELLIAELRCGEIVVATHLGFIHKATAYWYMPSYHGEWAAFSPGKVLMYKAIEWAIDQGLGEFDLLRGEEPFKDQLTKQHRILSDYTFSRGCTGKLTEYGYRRIQKQAKRRIKAA